MNNILNAIKDWKQKRADINKGKLMYYNKIVPTDKDGHWVHEGYAQAHIEVMTQQANIIKAQQEVALMSAKSKIDRLRQKQAPRNILGLQPTGKSVLNMSSGYMLSQQEQKAKQGKIKSEWDNYALPKKW